MLPIIPPKVILPKKLAVKYDIPINPLKDKLIEFTTYDEIKVIGLFSNLFLGDRTANESLFCIGAAYINRPSVALNDKIKL